jgi:tetratricopeptide (TPR) repeat protein
LKIEDLKFKIGVLCGLLALLSWGCTEREVRQRFERAEAYRQKGLVDEAIAEYRAILALRPKAVDARNNLGFLYARKGEFDRAIAEYEEALRVKPDFAEAHYNLGVACAARGLSERAVVAYQRAIQAQPGHAEAHNNLGALHAAQGRPQEALAEYEQAVRLRPDFAEARNNLGLLYAAQGRPQEALAEYERAVRLRPGDAEIRNNLGSACAETDRLDEAIRHYEEALRLRPGYPTARDNMAKARTMLEESRRERAAGEMRAKHILVRTETEALALLRELEAGASFEDLARRRSLDPSAQTGGDLGGFRPGDLLPEFEQEARRLAPGQVGGPIQTRAGYHVIKRVY